MQLYNTIAYSGKWKRVCNAKASRTKPLIVIPAFTVKTHSILKSYTLPPEKKGVRLIPQEDAASLIDLLHNEAKVI